MLARHARGQPVLSSARATKAEAGSLVRQAWAVVGSSGRQTTVVVVVGSSCHHAKVVAVVESSGRRQKVVVVVVASSGRQHKVAVANLGRPPMVREPAAVASPHQAKEPHQAAWLVQLNDGDWYRMHLFPPRPRRKGKWRVRTKPQ